MNWQEKLFLGLMVIITISSILIGKALYDIYDKLETGDHLRNARVSFSLHPDMPWATIPIFLREQIAMGHPGTKLDNTDLSLIIKFYNHLLATNKDRPVSIAGEFDKEGRLVGEVAE